MAKATIREKLIEQLLLTQSEVAPRSRKTTAKYVTFTSNDPGVFYFVGKAGALRKGKTVTESYSLEGTVRDRLIAAWDAAHAKGVR